MGVSVTHTMALPFTFFKSILMQKKNLWKFKYFTMQNYNLGPPPPKKKQNPLKETKILQDIIITLL